MPVPFHVEPLGPLFEPRRHPDVKDPCIVFDGERWHLFGTGCGLATGLEILHCTAPSLDGPWHEESPSTLRGVDHIAEHAAPGVVAEGSTFHLFLQQSFNRLGAAIEHLASFDGGRTFTAVAVAVSPAPGTDEASVYDPHPAIINGEKYLSYAAFATVGQPDLYLARSPGGSWDGPWERLGCILHHEQVDCHNQIGSGDYEWGLEGPQLVGLPDGRVLLTAVCFLAERPRGHRQRVILAVADDVLGPYRLIGPVLEPGGPEGENGHGTTVIDGDRVRVIYQERTAHGLPWRIMSARADVSGVATATRASAA